MIILIELRQALLLYQDYRMLLLTGPGRRHLQLGELARLRVPLY